MKNTESLFFSQAINACLSVAKSLGANNATAYELAVNATTETFCQTSTKKQVTINTSHNSVVDVVYRIICENKGILKREIARSNRSFRILNELEKIEILDTLVKNNKIYSKKQGQRVTYHSVV